MISSRTQLFQWRWRGAPALWCLFALLFIALSVAGAMAAGALAPAPAVAQALPSCDDVTQPDHWLENAKETHRIQPNCLAPGQQYRIVFMSRDTRAAGSSDIATYDSWLQDKAETSSTMPDDIADLFETLGSTADVNARVHTDTEATDDPGNNIPIFYFRGRKAADSYADFYEGGWDTNQPRDEHGNTFSTTTDVFWVWTGTNNDGTTRNPLGGSTVTFGRASSNSSHLRLGEAANTNSYRPLRLSPVLRANRPPQPVGTPPSLALRLGSSPATVDLAPLFTDPDDSDDFTYNNHDAGDFTYSVDTTASGYDPAVAVASIDGATLTVTPLAAGTITVTVTAADGFPGAVSEAQRIPVSVRSHACDSVTGPGDWLRNRQPDCLEPGQKYRILFMSRDARAASFASNDLDPSSDISEYDNWLRGKARSSSRMPDDIANGIKILGSTPPVNARVHTDTEATDDPDNDIPVFYYRGTMVADSYADLYDGSWDTSTPRDEHGNTFGAAQSTFRVWTGTNNAGATRNALDNQGQSTFGCSNTTDKPLHCSDAIWVNQHHYYGISALLDANSPPAAIGAPGPLVLKVDGAVLRLDVSEYFSDTDSHDTLTYSITGEPASDIATVALSGSTLTVTPGTGSGESAVTIAATDGFPDSSASHSIPIRLETPLTLCNDVAGPDDWLMNRQPDCLRPGQQYRILFASRGQRMANSADITSYDAWLQEQADASSQMPDDIASQFKVLGSTSSTNARAHTDTEASDDPENGILVFYYRGRKVADSYADLYDGSWDTAEARNERGEIFRPGQGGSRWVWTGTNNDGATSSYPLNDSGDVTYGDRQGTSNNLNDGRSGCCTNRFHYKLYGISPVLTASRPPAPVGTPAPVVLTIGGEAATVDLSLLFSDPDPHDTLTYSVTGEPAPHIATASISGSILTVTPGTIAGRERGHRHRRRRLPGQLCRSAHPHPSPEGGHGDSRLQQRERTGRLAEKPG